MKIGAPVSDLVVFEAWFRSESYKMQLTTEELAATDPRMPVIPRTLACKDILMRYRYPIISQLPISVEWYQCTLVHEDLGQLYHIFLPEWGHYCGLDGRVASSFKDVSFERGSESAVVLYGDVAGPYTILEGNHRIANAFQHKTWQETFPAFHGVSEMPCRWHRPNCCSHVRPKTV